MANPALQQASAFLERQIEALSPRDRKLLFGLFTFGTVAALGVMGWTLYGILDDKASRVRTAKENLATAKLYQVEYQGAAAQLAAQESRLREFEDKRLSAHLEEVASKRGVSENLRSVQESGSEVVGSIKQTRFSVELKDLEHADAIGFLYELETSGYPLSVNQAEFRAKKTRDGTSHLDLGLELLVFSLAEG